MNINAQAQDAPLPHPTPPHPTPPHPPPPCQRPVIPWQLEVYVMVMIMDCHPGHCQTLRGAEEARVVSPDPGPRSPGHAPYNHNNYILGAKY